MSKENLAFLFGGLAFGILIGLALFNAWQAGPAAPAASGAVASAQAGAGAQSGGAPMIEEINRLKRVLQDDPNNLKALVRLANLHHDVSMWDQAIGYYERAIEIAPEDPNLITDLGICYRGLQQFDRALEMFERAQKVDPQHWQSLFNTVVVAGFDLGRVEQASAALQAMEKINPNLPQLPDLRQALERARTAGSEKAGS